MRPEEYGNREAGQVVHMGTYWAFVPTLPQRVVYDDAMVRLLSEADAALSELSGAGRHLPNPHLLIEPYMRREAVLSSKIEGTRTTVAELLMDEFSPGAAGGDPADVQEVKNYVIALQHGIELLGSLPLSLRLVREVHRVLMQGVRGSHATPGEFRKSQNWIGRAGSTIESASYVPPPVEYLMDTLGAWEKFLHRREEIPDLVQCAIMHEHFEAIHPFLDGNGRVGRLLITLFLMERKRLSQPLLYLSAFFEGRRDDYYLRLQRVRTQGDWDGWLRFFLQGVVETAREANEGAVKLLHLRESIRLDMRDRPKALPLVDQLFINPYMTIVYAAKFLSVTYPTAKGIIEALVKDGVLTQIASPRAGKMFAAQAILRTVGGDREARRGRHD